MTEESTAIVIAPETAVVEATSTEIGPAPVPCDAARAAAEWWADCLRAPAKQDNGDALMSAFASFVSAETYREPTAEQLSKFTDALATAIRDRIARCDRCTLGVDYGPDHILSDAVTAAFGDSRCPDFPCKTMMWVEPDFVTVSCGYRATPEVIWPRKADLPEWRQHFWDWIEKAKRFGLEDHRPMRAATPFDVMCELHVASEVLGATLRFLTKEEGEYGQRTRELLDLMYATELQKKLAAVGGFEWFDGRFQFRVINRRPPTVEEA